jgi:hypothetical protein
VDVGAATLHVRLRRVALGCLGVSFGRYGNLLISLCGAQPQGRRGVLCVAWFLAIFSKKLSKSFQLNQSNGVFCVGFRQVFLKNYLTVIT